MTERPSAQVAGVLFPNQNPVEAANSIARLLPEGRFRLAGNRQYAWFRRWIHLQESEAQDHFGFSFRSSVNNHLSGKASFAFTSTGSVNVFLPNASPIPACSRTRPRKGA